MLLLRHLVAILLLPGVVAVVVPAWIRASYAASDSRWQGDGLVWVARAGAVLLLLAGIALFAWCVALFARVGRGTLAPWDPTRQIVAVGPYRYTRNPMISAVATVLAGQALWRGSWRLALWAGIFVAFNHAYFILVEEPGLRRRFGDPYRTYAAQVPRWIPRLLPPHSRR